MKNDQATQPIQAKKYHPVISLIDEVIRLNSRLRTIFAGTTDSTGLGSMPFTVLVAVVESKSPPTVPQIGRSLGHARQVIQRAANLLQEQGLITTVDNPNHKRAPLLEATEAGIQLKQAADLQAIKQADELLKMIDAGTCEQITDQLHTLRGKIEAHIKQRKPRDGTET